MIWLTWRQLRAQALVVFTGVAAVAVVLAVTGPRLLRHSRIGTSAFDHLTRTDRDLYYTGIVVVALIPALLGAFWGAPLVARELEAGTHRLAWNQSVPRTRWLAHKLGFTAAAAAAAAGVLTLGVTWWSDPVDGAQSSTRGSLPSRLTPIAFAMRGVAPIGYTVFAVALGVAIGIVIRRPLPAMALTLAVFTFVQIAVPLWVRPHLLSPTDQTVAISRSRLDGIESFGPGSPLRLTLHTADRGDWILSNQTVDSTGRPVSLPSWFNGCLSAPPPPSPSGQQPAHSPDDLSACLTRLTREGYRQHIVYQPADRFWALQWAETALFLALSVLVAGFCFCWVRYRVA